MQPNTASGNVAASFVIAGLGDISTRASFFYWTRIVFTDRLKTFFVGLSILNYGKGTGPGTKQTHNPFLFRMISFTGSKATGVVNCQPFHQFQFGTHD